MRLCHAWCVVGWGGGASVILADRNDGHDGQYPRDGSGPGGSEHSSNYDCAAPGGGDCED